MLDPIATTSHLSTAYLRYLKTMFRMQDPRLRAQYESELGQRDAITTGPLVESQPPFVAGSSIQELIDSGVLSAGFRDLSSPALPLSRPLYRHQEQAVRHVVQDQRNLVVATGTGSGKTESFLLPVLDHLLREREAGTLGKPGVRALLLYPMNALANDQLKRLRQILGNFPSITFGRYTGETLERQADAAAAFRSHHPGEILLPNELLSRDQMRDTPPHLLLTNYAMLEYLLLRPRDSEFFDGPAARHWRFLVLDEAHVYDGATGIEMAMLLRRLKDRIGRESANRLRCIATSATIGKGRPDYGAVARFAEAIFDEPFEFDPDQPTCQDVVEATRAPLPDDAESAESLLPSEYMNLHRQLSGTDEVSKVVPAEAWLRRDGSWPRSRDPEEVDAWLHRVLRRDGRLHGLQSELLDGPRPLGILASKVFGEAEDAAAATAALIALAARARPEPGAAALLRARYHFFARALEGCFVCFGDHERTGSPGPKAFLARHDRCPDCAATGRASEVFEVGVCNRCGAEYVLGRIERDGEQEKLVQNASVFGDQLAYLLVGARGDDDEDESVAVGEERDDTDRTAILCCGCGVVSPAGSEAVCGCREAVRIPVVRAEIKDAQGPLRRCLACGSRSNQEIVGRFLTGQDAPVSVLATALYETLPPASDHAQSLPGEGRKLLVFADSRQDAAFFAPYLEANQHRLLRRRLLVDLLRGSGDARRGDLRIEDVAKLLLPAAAAAGFFKPEQSKWDNNNTVLTWLMLEFLAWDRRNSPEGLGLLTFRPVPVRGWRPPTPLLTAPWGLTETEAVGLVTELLDTLRRQGAVTFPNGVSPEGEEFQPRTRVKGVRGAGSAPREGILSWEPTARTNGRLDLLLRLLDRTSPGLDADRGRKEATQLLRGLWTHLTDASGPWRNHLLAEHVGRDGVLHRVNHAMWEVVPGDHDSVHWSRCDRCGILTSASIRGTCPTLGCRGTTHPVSAASLSEEDNHYRVLYTSLLPRIINAREHTAQWTNDEALKIQEEFIKGRVNVLSCSTTFELGVDVGDLQSVLMRNVPPTTANYLQRAGRAGRRTDAAAFAVTFAQRRSHDLTMYRQPERLVAGKVPPPVISVTNPKIVRRHIHSVALSAFFRWASEEHKAGFPGTVETFFAKPELNGPKLLTDYLAKRPSKLGEALARVVPEVMHDELGVVDWSWIEALLGESFLNATHEVEDDLQMFSDRIQEAVAREDFRAADQYKRMRKTVLGRELLGFLASRNVLPKYGFPVDVVELITRYAPTEDGRRLELTRDLRIALAEYAPGSQIVAGGRVWTGGGLLLRPGWQTGGERKGWDERPYAVCPACLRFNQSEIGKDPPTTCGECGLTMERGHQNMRGQYVRPEYGFVASPEDPPRSGDSRPHRSFASRVYCTGLRNENREMVRMERDRGYAVSFSRGEELAVVNPGPMGRGFRLCDRCGFGTPAPLPGKSRGKEEQHRDPRTGRRCGGTLRTAHLGHTFRTDVLSLDLPFSETASTEVRLSLLYALLEGVSLALGISRDDLDGVVYGRSPLAKVVMFDNVPGGAGHAQRIGREFDEVVQAARGRVEHCECGVETSCYECLRGYANQPYHEILTRQAAIDALSHL